METRTIKQPALFLGHGDPQIAVHDDELTRGLAAIGARIRRTCGTPRAILMMSAHWYTNGLFVQSSSTPRQIFDMYGFPQALYNVKYEVEGCAELTQAVIDALGTDVAVNDDWGVDHGTWTVLAHLFPEADFFDQEIARAVRNRDDRMVLDYRQLAGADFSVPTPEHFMPLLFVLGASKGEVPTVFNEMRQYAGISMTSFLFGATQR